MYLEAKPLGVNPPRPEDRIPIWQVTSGDDWMLTTRITLPNSTTPATPDNSRVSFVLTETRFTDTPIWTAEWLIGIQPVDLLNHPGLISIRIPDTISAALRRGAYAFSLTVADAFGRHLTTSLKGTLQVEYEPTSPQHDIPYR